MTAELADERRCFLCPFPRLYSRGLCRSCYRKMRQHGLPMPAACRWDGRGAGQRVRRLREWIARLGAENRALLRSMLDEVVT